MTETQAANQADANQSGVFQTTTAAARPLTVEEQIAAHPAYSAVKELFPGREPSLAELDEYAAAHGLASMSHADRLRALFPTLVDTLQNQAKHGAPVTDDILRKVSELHDIAKLI